MASYFFEEIENFPIDEKFLNSWIDDCIAEEGFDLGELTYIFCSDEYLLNINRQYLNHDYYTDIITFNYNEDTIIGGDLFVSIDRVREYARDNNIRFEDEFKRVIIHGVLHLVGYNDKLDTEIVEMRNKEEYYISKY